MLALLSTKTIGGGVRKSAMSGASTKVKVTDTGEMVLGLASDRAGKSRTLRINRKPPARRRGFFNEVLQANRPRPEISLTIRSSTMAPMAA